MLVNTLHKRATKQALASLVQRHGYSASKAAVATVEAVGHFGLQVGNLSRVSEMERYASACQDGPNALWDTLSLSGTLVRRAKSVLPA